jgi:hypothetical protein
MRISFDFWYWARQHGRTYRRLLIGGCWTPLVEVR